MRSRIHTINDEPSPNVADVKAHVCLRNMPRRLRALLYSVERAIVGVAIEKLREESTRPLFERAEAN